MKVIEYRQGSLERLSVKIGENIEQTVKKVIDEVVNRGDEALVEFAEKFDGVKPDGFRLEFPKEEWGKLADEVPDDIKEAIDVAIERVGEFHSRQFRESWFTFKNDSVLGELVVPVRRAGLYVPGGKASYPSTAVMTITPAKVAGVEQIFVSTPPRPDGTPDPAVVYVAYKLEVDKVFLAGGAGAVAAFAFGTETVPKVDVVAGPGNAYFTVAKKVLYGTVGIDILAGPSEVCVIADDSAEPELVSMDLLAQAEHSPDTRIFLVSTSREFVEQVEKVLSNFTLKSPRREILSEPVEDAVAVVVKNLDEAFECANEIAPEHLQVVADVDTAFVLSRVRTAGAVFIGKLSTVPLGDYILGPNHTLPTGGAGRFEGPLGVENFLKRISVAVVGESDFNEVAEYTIKLAEYEGLIHHADAVRLRLNRTDER